MLKKSRFIIGSFFLFFLANMSFAFSWTSANELHIAWDAVKQKTDGTPIDAQDTVKYKIYFKDRANIETFYKEVDVPKATIYFEVVGELLIGVSSVLYRDAQLINESTISWSNAVGTAVDSPFWVKCMQKPGTTTGKENAMALDMDGDGDFDRFDAHIINSIILEDWDSGALLTEDDNAKKLDLNDDNYFNKTDTDQITDIISTSYGKSGWPFYYILKKFSTY